MSKDNELLRIVFPNTNVIMQGLLHVACESCKESTCIKSMYRTLRLLANVHLCGTLLLVADGHLGSLDDDECYLSLNPIVWAHGCGEQLPDFS